MRGCGQGVRATSSLAINIRSFKATSSVGSEGPLRLSCQYDDGGDPAKAVSRYLVINDGRGFQCAVDCKCCERTQMQVSPGRRGRPRQQVWSIQDLALSVKVQSDSQQPH